MALASYITATANLKPSFGKLKGIFVSSASATPTITIYDSAAATTTKTLIGVFTPVSATNYFFPADGLQFNNGLYIVISGTVAATVSFE
ncbi:hypothetical protein UFOVP171_7 [uncultured Caudovirales phage]|jgi:hypothetical protein|uniref:Uncharacterized protein n=1 Tax=uncultured Caudovirales phage TaxID=2100421 RepID=A0A6J7WFX7_9CAUD|nr:hypothetical protein UFOVP171_7 [uncultured Caudovirales phage]